MKMLQILVGREYREWTRSRAFWMTTVLGAALVVSLSFLPAILDRMASTSQVKVAVVDASGQLATALSDGIPERLPDGRQGIVVRAVPTPEDAEAEVEAGRIKGYIAVGDSVDAPRRFTYTSPEPGREVARLEAALSALSVTERLEALGLPPERISGVLEPVRMSLVQTGSGPSAEERRQSRSLAYALVFILYATVLAYGGLVSTSVVSEKSSRITELMASAVRPEQLMAGKVAGLGLVGLTQYGIWLGVAVGVSLLHRFGVDVAALRLSEIPVSTFLLFAAFFVLAFLLYGSLYATLSIPASRAEDVAQLALPLNLVIVLSLAFSFTAVAEPGSALARTLSFVPFFTPTVMFARTQMGSVTAAEVGLAMLGLVATIAVALYVAGRVYRASVLLYGQRPRLGEVVRLVRFPAA